MKTLSRRALLRHAATGLGLCATAIAPLGLVGCGRRDLASMEVALVELASTRESLTAIGDAYLADRPDESRRSMGERLANDLDWSKGTSSEQLSERLLARIQRDFEESKTTRVRGWMLSETEARWAALISLLPAPVAD